MSLKRYTARLQESGAMLWILSAAAAVLILLVSKGAIPREAEADASFEARLEMVLSEIEGVGRVSVMVGEYGDEITGVLIVCEGADDLTVRLRVQEAAKTLMAIDNEKISVVKMEARNDESG